VGFAFTSLGLSVLLFVVGRYLLEGGSVPGFPFLASVIAIFSGAQMFALGIIGEYLARMHFRTMDRPSYAIRGSALSELPQAVLEGTASLGSAVPVANPMGAE
jgi:undecaprenyl-phosphate 4-deoxy-4-formamido-L-arabinose transferase